MPSDTQTEPGLLNTSASVMVPEGGGKFRLDGPAVMDQLAVASCAAKLAVLTQFANNDMLPARLRAACATASDDMVEEFNSRVSTMARVWGEDVVERMLRMHAAAMAAELSRFLLARADEDANDLG